MNFFKENSLTKKEKRCLSLTVKRKGDLRETIRTKKGNKEHRKNLRGI